MGDQNSVLDQSIRIIQASIDALTELGYLSSCMMMMTLLQCVKSARWPDDGPLAILPGVDLEKERQRHQAGKMRRYSLTEIHALPKPVLQNVLRNIDIPPNTGPQVTKIISILPDLKVNVTDITALGLTVNITRLNPNVQPDYHIYAPRFPKAQTEGFFVVVTDPARDEILTLKRVNWPGAEQGRRPPPPTAKAMFKLEPEAKERKLEVLVVSDAYVGMVWKIGGVDVPAVPVLDDDDSKKKAEGKE